MVHAHEFLLHLILESEDSSAGPVVTRSEPAHLIGQFSANLSPVKPRILTLQAIEFACALANLCRTTLSGEGHNRARIGGNKTAAHLSGGVGGH